MSGFSISKMFARQRAATADVAKGVEQIRIAIVVAQDEAAGIAALPIDRARAIAAVDAGIASLADRFDDRMLVAALTRPHDGRPRLALESMTVPFLAAIAPDMLRAALVERVDAFYEGRDDLPEAERARRIEQLEDRILELELAEESAIRAAERAGMAILRRADADPRAVLAADDCLPG